MKPTSKVFSKSQVRWTDKNRTLVSTVESNPWRERVRTEHKYYELAHANQTNTRPLPVATQEEVSQTYNSFSAKTSGQTMPSPVTTTHNTLTTILAQRVNDMNYRCVRCPGDMDEEQKSVE